MIGHDLSGEMNEARNRFDLNRTAVWRPEGGWATIT